MEQQKPATYKDLWFRITASLLAAFFIDSLNREESFFERLVTGYFYTDLLGGFCIAFLLSQIIKFVTERLDRKYDWTEKTVARIVLQVAGGIIVPAIVSFILTFLFMKLAYGQDIFSTAWLYNEFYAVILIIVLFNLVYFTWWLYLRQQIMADSSVKDPAATTDPEPGVDDEADQGHKNIQVSKAGMTVLLPVSNLACAYLSNGYCYLKTFEGESYLTTYSLDEIAEMTAEHGFFRANRQVLINRKSCIGYKSIENGKIEVDIDPPLKFGIVVSQKRAKDFRKWIS